MPLKRFETSTFQVSKQTPPITLPKEIKSVDEFENFFQSGL